MFSKTVKLNLNPNKITNKYLKKYTQNRKNTEDDEEALDEDLLSGNGNLFFIIYLHHYL